MPRNGQFYYGKGGFSYKKNSGGGTHRTFPIGLISGVPADVFNSYVPGSGVGPSNTFNRRAKLQYATACKPEQPCGKFFLRLGVQPNRSLTPGN